MREENIQAVHREGNNHTALIKAKVTHSPDEEVDKDPSAKTQHNPKYGAVLELCSAESC